MRTRPLFAALAIMALAGCAADPAPHEQLRLSEQALEQAKAVGATDEVAELKLAEAKLARARVNMSNESFRDARVRAEQAELDARLAEARVLTAKSEEQLKVLQSRVDRLRKQLGSSSEFDQAFGGAAGVGSRWPAGVRQSAQ